jgi:molybdopterin-binding protein
VLILNVIIEINGALFLEIFTFNVANEALKELEAKTGKKVVSFVNAKSVLLASKEVKK